MKVLTLTSAILATLSLSSPGQGNPTLRSQISLKEKQLAEIQKELSDLRSRLDAPSAASYLVQTGDTVHSIARRHGVSAADIMKWNGITDPTKLGIGEKLVVSEKSSGGTDSVTHKATAPTATGRYVVAKGDTFYSIARRHKMSVSELRALNPNVTTHLIAPGQGLAVSGKAHPIARQETRKATPQKTSNKPAPRPEKSSTATTLARKTTNPAPIRETEVVALKKNEAPAPTPPAPPVVKDPEPASSVASIILTEETTFDAFARKHGTSTSELNKLNGWNLPKATVLARGSEIYVPK